MCKHVSPLLWQKENLTVGNNHSEMSQQHTKIILSSCVVLSHFYLCSMPAAYQQNPIKCIHKGCPFCDPVQSVQHEVFLFDGKTVWGDEVNCKHKYKNVFNQLTLLTTCRWPWIDFCKCKFDFFGVKVSLCQTANALSGSFSPSMLELLLLV